MRLVIGKVKVCVHPDITPGLYGIFWRSILWFGDEWVGIGVQLESKS